MVAVGAAAADADQVERVALGEGAVQGGGGHVGGGEQAGAFREHPRDRAAVGGLVELVHELVASGGVEVGEERSGEHDGRFAAGEAVDQPGGIGGGVPGGDLSGSLGAGEVDGGSEGGEVGGLFGPDEGFQPGSGVSILQVDGMLVDAQAGGDGRERPEREVVAAHLAGDDHRGRGVLGAGGRVEAVVVAVEEEVEPGAGPDFDQRQGSGPGRWR